MAMTRSVLETWEDLKIKIGQLIVKNPEVRYTREIGPTVGNV
jgi:hypothetical protein